MPQACHSLLPGSTGSHNHVERADDQLTLTLAAAPGVFIAGLSAAALCCSEFAVALGFTTRVCEHRPEVLSDYADSLNEQVQLIREFPAKYIKPGLPAKLRGDFADPRSAH